jgi:hypothetical protein
MLLPYPFNHYIGLSGNCLYHRQKGRPFILLYGGIKVVLAISGLRMVEFFGVLILEATLDLENSSSKRIKAEVVIIGRMFFKFFTL